MLIIPMVITLMPEGDDKAFMDTLYRNHHRLMLFVAWKYVRDKAAVEDILDLNGKLTGQRLQATYKGRILRSHAET